MIVDLNAMLRGEVNSIDIDFVLTPEIIEDVTFTDGARVHGKITNSAGYMRLTLQADLPYIGECARCLDEVRGVFSLDFERTVVTEGMVSEEKLEENIDEYIVLDDGKLELDENGEEKIEIRTILPLTICFDHRALDFSEVAPFIRKLEEIFNNPEIILGE